MQLNSLSGNFICTEGNFVAIYLFIVIATNQMNTLKKKLEQINTNKKLKLFII